MSKAHILSNAPSHRAGSHHDISQRDPRGNLRSLISLALNVLVSGCLVTSAQVFASPQESDAKPDTEIVAEQYLLVGSATRGCGESQLAINPLNPNQMAVSAMCGTFSAPFKVSSAPSPGVSRRRSMSNHGNDFISVAADDDFVHMTWFDDRAGFRATRCGRVPITDYK